MRLYNRRYRCHAKKWVENNREKVNKSKSRYYYKNKIEINKKKATYMKKRRLEDRSFKLKWNIRNLIRNSLNKKCHRKTSRTAEIVGCDLDTLCKYLFATWEKNYGTKWNGEEYHIDHIIPLATAKTEEDVIRLCHYTNLQMLTPEDNLAKSDKKC